MNSKKVYPVIHCDTIEQAIDQAAIANECDADGIFLISHYGHNRTLFELLPTIKQLFPNLEVGINCLGQDIRDVLRWTIDTFYTDHPLDMLWFDSSGVNNGLVINDDAILMKSFKLLYPNINIFAGVAFKYQEADTTAPASTNTVAKLGLIPTTSGPSTGSPPTIEKLKSMKDVTPSLAIASGMDCNNIEEFLPFLSHILVATGVSKDFYTFDYEKLRTFIGKVRNTKDGTNS